MKTIPYALLTAMFIGSCLGLFALTGPVSAQNPQQAEPLTKKLPRVTKTKSLQVTKPGPGTTLLNPFVKLINPGADAKIDVGGNFPLSWTGIGVNTVALDLILPEIEGSGPVSHQPQVVVPVLGGLAPTGTVSWAVSDRFVRWQEYRGKLGMLSQRPVNTYAFLRIRGTAADGKSVEQSIPVHMVLPTLKITSPKQNENYYSGLWHTVTWTTTGAKSAKVRVVIGVNGKSLGVLPTWSTEAPNSGSFRFRVPAEAKTEGQSPESYLIGVKEVFENPGIDSGIDDWVGIRLH